MKRGQCPKCGSTEIYTSRQSGYYGVLVSWLSVAPVSCFVCAGCGLVEKYIDSEKHLTKIAQGWDRAGQA
jgi:membrane protein YqaA with SNARE-associated domain